MSQQSESNNKRARQKILHINKEKKFRKERSISSSSFRTSLIENILMEQNTNTFFKATFQLMLTCLALFIGDYLLDGFSVDSSITVIVSAIVITLLNRFLKPILIALTIPATLFTLGLFLLVINASMLLIAGELVDGFKIDGFWTALWLSFVISLTHLFLGGSTKAR
jgi:putative membrane protein